MNFYVLGQGLLYGTIVALALGVLWKTFGVPLMYFLGFKSKQVEQHGTDLQREYHRGVEDGTTREERPQ